MRKVIAKKPSPIYSFPSRKFVIIVPNRHPELARRFIQSVRDTHKKMPSIIVVRDGHKETFGDDVIVLDGKQPFIYSRNCNIGIRHFGNRDVFLCNDDLVCTENSFFPLLRGVAYLYPQCGIMSPLIKGGVGNKWQQYYGYEKRWQGLPCEVAVTSTLHFPCVFIKRQVINKIGLLDENFVGYGFEDVDYCVRAFHAQFALMISRQFCIIHGDGSEGIRCGLNYSLTFGEEPVDDAIAISYFNKKYPELSIRPTGNNARVIHDGG